MYRMRKYKIVLVFLALILIPLDGLADKAEDFMEDGITKSEAGNLEGALSDFTRAIDLDPQNPKPYYGSALARIILGNTESGCKDAKKSFDMGYARAEELLTKYCQ